MLLEELMQEELIEHPELWMNQSEMGYLIIEYLNQLIEDVEHVVYSFRLKREGAFKKSIDAMGWKFVDYRDEDGRGVITLEACYEPDGTSPLRLKCTTVMEVETQYWTASSCGPTMLYFPNGETRNLYEVREACQDGDFELLKKCIDIGKIDVMSVAYASSDCVVRVNKYRWGH